MDRIDLKTGYRGLSHVNDKSDKPPENLVILAFSVGGTRAAAFSYGVLEALREMKLQESNGQKSSRY